MSSKDLKELFFAFFIIIIKVLLCYAVKWLWNYVMPYVFGLPEIDFLRAAALYVLCSILFRQKVTITKKHF